MQSKKLTMHLWFDTQAKEAAEFYVATFGEVAGMRSEIQRVNTLEGTPSGTVDVVTFQILDQPFQAISAGPYFKLNPSISFMVNFDPSQDQDAKARIDTVWAALSEGGKVLMPLDTYPFSERYGWIEDKYGVSWQLILTKPEGEERPLIIPSLLFVGDVYGKAEEASDFYLSVFKNSKRGALARYGAGREPDTEQAIMFTDFKLDDQWLVAMDSAHMHDFGFNEAVSLVVSCETQEEIDYYWEKLSAVPESEQCGWLKDKYGVSWQIVPSDMEEMMSEGTPEQMARVTQAFLQMKKFDIAKLRAVYEGKNV
ncbi:MAG: VOC family protein [Candidatus Moranbacteria bacterium]|nr:VOC family protein [Candidatus Moranbacteria bacterium]